MKISKKALVIIAALISIWVIALIAGCTSGDSGSSASTMDIPISSSDSSSSDSSQYEDEFQNQTVYYTRTGEKYHYNSNCGNGTYYPCTLQEALDKGLEPCKKCVLG